MMEDAQKKKKTKINTTFQQQNDDRIAENVIQWVQNHNNRCAENTKKVFDYGQIHFSENDRTSWFIRFPFVVSDANQTVAEPKNKDIMIDTVAFPRDENDRESEVSLKTPLIATGSISTLIANIPINKPGQILSPTTPAAQLVDFMRKAWKIPLPELIISVTGGARLFKLTNPQLRSTFQKGLVSAAVNTNAWVFTGGNYSGVMKEVGDIFEKCTYKSDKTHTRVPVIGISSWFYTTDREQLSQSKPLTSDTNILISNQTNQELTSSIFKRPVDFEKLYRNRFPTKNETPSSFPIDPNHTHFILLDDGYDDTDTEWKKHGYPIRADLTLPLRAEIEQEARKFNNQGEIHQIPIVQILLEGGPSSILTVYEAIKHKTPVIIIQGTGRAADLMANLYNAIRLSNETGNEPELDSLIEQGRNDNILNINNEERCLQMIKSKEDRRFFTIFTLRINDSEFELGDAILEALFKATEATKEQSSEIRIQKFRLSMVWNKYDQVVNDLLNENKENTWTETQLDTALCEAFHYGSIRFVELLIDQGASFDRLRRLINLEKLYNKTQIAQSLPLKQNSNDDVDIQQIYYERYLKKNALKTIESYQRMQSFHPSNIYGTTQTTNDDLTNFCGKVVFNEDDVIRQNGYVAHVSIAFLQESKPLDINLYVISPMIDTNCFQVIYRYRISEENDFDEEKIVLPDSTVYLEAGQFLAIGFGLSSASPKHISGGKHYTLRLDQVDDAYGNNTSIKFYQGNSQVAISFHLVPTHDFIRDIFLWSVFVDRYNETACLCSHSPNTTTAALLASKIYKRAAELTYDKDKINEYRSKEKKFDVHAAEIIDKCFIQHEEFALQVLTTKSKLYFDYSPLELGTETNSRSFLATKCVQKYLGKLWYGDINQHGFHKVHINLLIFILCIFPFLLACPCISNIFKSSNEKGVILANKKCRWLNFFVNRAVIRFYYSIIFSVLFLSLFTFVVLVDYFPLNNNGGKRNGYNIRIPLTEIILHVCIWSLIIEEIRQFIIHCYEEYERRSEWSRIVLSYFDEDKWNILDIITILIYLIAFITRFIVIENTFIVSKICISIDLFLWFVRTLHLFAVSERLGPKLLMIFNTMKDLTFFIYFILIFLAGYSISSYALLTTNNQVFWIPTDNNSPSRTYRLTQNGTDLWTWNLLRNIVDWGMWKIYGQIELINHNQVGNNSDLTVTNDAYGNTAFILTIIFVCVANVLLLNVLVALFNVTFKHVEQNAHDTWAYHRFLLVKEYSKKSPFPPPLNSLHYGCEFVVWIFRFFINKKYNTIGLIDTNSSIDANPYGLIVFNGADRIDRNGTINEISINFCRAPTSNTAVIRLYIIKAKTKNPTQFDICEHQQPISDLNKSSGVQTFKVQIFVEKGDYLGFHFPFDAGSPFTLNGDSYFAKLPHSSRNAPHLMDKKCEELSFLHCASQGISVKFTIKDTRSIRQRIIETFKRSNTINLEGDDQTNTLSTGRLHQNERVYYNLTEFQKRDNMLRESSIAQDHWQEELKRIMQEERGE